MKNAECFISCFLSSNFMVFTFVLVLLAFFSAIGYFISRDGMSKVKYYWLLNVFVLSSVLLVYLTMSCDMLWFLKIYFIYVGFATVFLLIMPSIYRVYLSKRFSLERFVEMENVLKEFSGSAKARLYIFGSAVPKAFTVGKNVFISAGMADLLEIEEIKAVTAHEAFHVNQNKYPFLNNFKILTFILLPDTQLEASADSYAERIVGKEILQRAKTRVRDFYLD